MIEAPIGAIPKQEMLALMLEPPAWAVGLPLGGKVRSGALYLEAPIDRETETAVPHAQSPDPGGDVVVGDVVVVGKVVDPVRHGGDPGRHFADHANVGDSGGNVRDVGDVGDGGNPARHFTDHADLGDSDGDLGNSAHDPHICIYCKLDPPDGTERAVAVAGAWLHPRCEDAFIRARMAEEGIPMGAQSQSPSPPPQSPPPSGESTFSVGNGGSGFGALGDGFGDIARGGNGRARDDYPHGERETGRKVAEHIYPDLKSKPYLKVAKYVLANGKKSFPQYHLENGQWVKGKPEGPAIPYRLPELLAAPPNATVEICEGEKDADNLAALGLIPTTNPGGAGKWTPDMNKWLTGFARANIYEDNDEAGRKHAAKVARELTGVVSDIRIITFRELPEHGDVSDWLKTGKTRADLLARAEEAPKFAALESVCAADEDIAALDWVWPGHFALKKIGLITGLPNEGKGVLLSDIMAHITTGAAWPCNGGSALLGNVILLTAEDDINDTIVPRLMAAGADRERVHIVKMMREADKERMFNLVTDLPVLRQKATEIGDVKAIIIDPVAAYLGIGKVDSFRATDVRAVLGPLKLFAEEATTLILGVMHFNKKTDVTNVMLRVSDSLAYTAAARHVYAVIDDEENGRKLFVKGKNNLAPPGQKTLAFSIAEREVGTDKRTGNPVHAPHIVWHPDPVDITATEALRAASENKSPSARDNAKQLLEMLLSSGPAGSKDVKEAAKENGISWGTVRRAAEVLGVDIKKDGPLNDKGEITWRWHLPVPPHEKHTEGAHRGRGEHLRSE